MKTTTGKMGGCWFRFMAGLAPAGVLAGFLFAAAPTRGQSLPPDTIQITSTQAAAVLEGSRFYRMSSYEPGSPPLPGGVLFLIIGNPEDPGDWSGCPIWYSAAARSLWLDDRALVAEEMVLKAAAGANLMMTLDEEEGEEQEYDLPSLDTSGLYLDLDPTNVTADLAAFNLHNGTNQVYGIFSTDLAGAWNFETLVFPSNAPSAPFTLPTLGRSRLLVRAQDLTGVVSPGNQVPDWWLYYYYGQILPDSTLDSDSNSFLYDYTNGLAPANRIVFAAQCTNYFVNSDTALLSFTIYSGIPAFMAVVFGTNDFSSAQWLPYSPQVAVSLPADGVYNCWISLRPWSPDAAPAVTWVGLTRDLHPPDIVITSPASSVTAQPMIDLRGYSPERLCHLEYDLANDAGTVTHIQGFVTDQYLDPATHDFTTNWFLLADLELVSGTNVVTVRATDMANNVSTNTFTYTLDLSTGTNPPVLTLYWPQDAEKVCDNQFTVRGRLDDPTATVSAQISDAAGNTTVVKGLVERNGLVWVENLPLASGTNTVTLTMTNASGYSSMTNFTVIHSDDVNLTIDDVPQDQLANPLITVTGTIDSPDFTVWVNGVMATNMTDNWDGTWSWEADYVQLNSGGTAVIQAVAIPNSDNGGQGAGMEAPVDNAVPGNPSASDRRGKEADPEKGATRYTEHYHSTYDITWTFAADTGAWITGHSWWAKDWTNRWTMATNPIPANGLLVGTYNEGWVASGAYPGPEPFSGSYSWDERDYLFPDRRGLMGYYTETNSPGGPNASGSNSASLWSAYEKWEDHTPFVYGGYYVDGMGFGYTTGRVDRVENIQVKLFTGAKRLPKWKNFFELSGAATNFPTTDWLGTRTPQTVTPEAIQVLGKQLVGSGMTYPFGMNYKALPDNEVHDITPVVKAPRYAFTVNAPKHNLGLQYSCPLAGTTNRTDLGVAEQVTLSFAPGLTLNSYWHNTWSSTAGSVSPTNGNQTTFTAPTNVAGATPATVTATLNDEHCDCDFNILPPSGVLFAQPPLGVKHTYRYCEAGFHAQVIIMPTNVSFHNIEISEMDAPITGDGCYAYMNGTQHHSWLEQGVGWLTPDCNNYLNTVVDFVWLAPVPPSYAPGNCSVQIPWNYRAHGANNDGYNFTTLPQTTTAAANGRCTTSKANITIYFDPSDPTVSW